MSPVDPAIQVWLSRELPSLRDEGLLSQDQARRIAARYAVSLPTGAAGETPAPLTSQSPASTPAPDVAPRFDRPVRQPGALLAPFLSEHGVAIVLYLGAFLVVSAVAIYLGYNWGQVGGPAKLAALLSLMLGFFAAAAACLPRPSVRQAGRTFLALGALLVPANIGGVYAFLLADGPLPRAAFWLVGAVLAGALYAALSIRLDSRGYGVLATFAPPIAGAAFASLLGLDESWLPLSAQVALTPVLWAAGRGRHALAEAGRSTSCWLLGLGVLALVFGLAEPGWLGWAVAGALVLTAVAFGWEAARAGGLWKAGPFAGAAFAASVSVVSSEHAATPSLVAIVATAAIYVVAARRLEPRPALAWDAVGGVLAWLPPLFRGNDSWSAAALFGMTAALFTGMSVARRSPLPLYFAVLAVDGSVHRVLAAVGSPDSPAWRLGAALWPVALAWWGASMAAPGRWSGPFLLGAAATGAGATLLTLDQRALNTALSASLAVATLLAARRHNEPAGLAVSVPWVLLAGHQAAAWAGFDESSRFAASGLGAWLFAPIFAAIPARGSSTVANGRSSAEVAALAGDARTRSRPGLVAWAQRADWRRAAQAAGVGTAGLAAMGVALTLGGTRSRSEMDIWLTATTCVWANLAIFLGVVATRGRVVGAALGALLAVIPALFAGIARLHPTSSQAFALPIGLYLLTIAYAVRRFGGRQRAAGATVLAWLGAAVLLGPGLAQSLDEGKIGYALWTALEGLALVGWGIATRWRPVVICGVAAVVAVALRQLFDAVYALPSWAILGGTGILLLGGAVGLLVLRARLQQTGRLLSEHWSSWD